MEYLVVADVDGTLYGVWSDDLIALYEVEKGKVEVERASHVEPCKLRACAFKPLHWHVWEANGYDLMLYKDFYTRQEALNGEKEEIERRLQEYKKLWTS